MSRGNRNILAAIGLVALIAAIIGVATWPTVPTLERYSYERPDAEDYHPGGSQCEPSAIAAVRDGVKRLSKADACTEQAQTYRHDRSDLIQQTRAGDAAQAQAEIASQGLWTAWFQTVGGFITLAAAIAAAFYARDAAKEGKRTADEAEHSRLSYIQGERAHLAFSHATVEQGEPTEQLILHFGNTGNTLAEIQGLAIEFTDEPIWPGDVHPWAEGLQIRVPSRSDGHIKTPFRDPVMVPVTVSGFIQYSTLTLTNCRTHFCFALVEMEKIYGPATMVMQKIEYVWLPHDT